jgi:serralysin
LWGGDTTGANDGARDTFVFSSLETGRTIGTADVIYDFVNGTAATADRIDLSLMDAKVDTIPNDAFTFYRRGKRSQASPGNCAPCQRKLTYISGDTDGNRTADFYIDLSGAKTLAATDFIL